jgi:hypothetical protein
MRAKFNLTMSMSDLMVLLSTGCVQIANGKNEFWIKAGDSIRKAVKVTKAPDKATEGKPAHGAAQGQTNRELILW